MAVQFDSSSCPVSALSGPSWNERRKIRSLYCVVYIDNLES